MVDNFAEPQLRLIDLLPAIYQDQDTGEQESQDQDAEGPPNYMPRFLRPFEKVLWGAHARGGTKKGTSSQPGLLEEIEQLNALLDPWQAPEEFLEWLGGWAALDVSAHMRPERKRALIAAMIPLYRIRGTRRYLEELLRLCVDVPTAVEEEDIPPLQVGRRCTIGRDTYVGGGPPHFFRVRMMASHLTVPELEEQRHLAYQVIELAKPVHTGYEFQIDSPQMQIEVHSTVGIDTVLGPAPAV
jgi:phage tail-like protein